MIPTSVTNSPPAAGLAQNGAVVVVNGAAAATVAVAATTAQQQSNNNNYSSIVLGLASLILEGRPIADDEYQQQQQQQQQQSQQQAAQQMTPPTPPSSTVTGSSSGRLSPRPSTSRAAINITTNPYAMASNSPRSNSQGYEYGQAQAHPGHGQVYALGLGYGQAATTTSSSNSNSSSATHQRWTQKLCQLRQVSPAAQSMSVEPELVSLSINELNAERGDFEIVRRVMLNRAGVGGGMGGLGGGAGGVGGGGGSGATGELLTASNSSAGSSPGSTSGTDNILHSLQSLATTCLRGGPVVPAEMRPLSLSLGGFGSPGTAGTVSAASLLDYNCSRTATGVAAAGAAAASTTTATTIASTTSATASSDGIAASGINNSNSSCASRPKHGPHCDQFLRKMGLAKGDAADAEEHFCDMSYINITCSRWRAHCLKMEAILARREPVCIEVYLGPAGHKILLEQWIISGKEKVPPPTMTLPSLCSAIRSQLYFSQIVAWCDLLRKGDASVYESGRVIFANGSTSNAGDLAGVSGGACTGVRRPRLNIFYRIRPHDVNAAGNNEAGGFSGKANVHNFPHVNIAENFSVAVCVKSLPRINGGLPHIATPPPPPATVSKPRMPTPSASTPTGGGGMCAATPTGLGARIVFSTTPPSAAAGHGGGGGGEESVSCDMRGERVEEEPAEDDVDGHRERQLLKYRKRMQRRDKKRERKPSDALGEEPMDEGGSEEFMTTTTPTTTPTTAMPAAAGATQTAMVMTLAAPRRIAMISTGTQTSLSSCQQCGSEKTLLCLNCADEEGQGRSRGEGGVDEDEDEDDTSASEMEDTSSCSLSSSDLIVGTPRNKAELLLQAIQRTPKNRKPTSSSRSRSHNNNNNTPKAAGNDLKKQQQQQQQQNNNQHKAMPMTAAPTSSGCQVCKRQKTQHNFSNGTRQAASNGNSMEQEEEEEQQQQQQQEQHTKLTPNVKSCTLLVEQERCQTPPAAVDEHIVVQFKTPLSHLPLQQQQQQQQQQLPLGKACNQLRLNCSGMGQLLDRETPPPTTTTTTTMSSMLSPLLRKALPKVNLTTIFCSSAPVAIDSEQLAFCFEPSSLAYTHTQSQSLLTPPEVGAAAAGGGGGGALSVQKSYSAPTLPNALSVSPRFAKQAAFYKRRSRHLSDRSDRSSLGSDEQLSDEDFESGLYSPAGSPLKTRARLATQFGCRPLLGNLEESLLQKRLLPKIEVAGFRLQLGASGGFCPTQLTIPASSYFYELHGETLSTPYLCEIRLPRKGYFVPRSGTVQATLLNPMGTVVRMFVIPYDMRDMPPLHRTFIRQRILAEELPSNPCARQQPERERTTREPPSSPTATSTTSKLGHFISAEQMKRLRYSIHLRFQTSRSGRLSLHTDIRLLISRRTDCDTAAAHAKGLLEAPNELVTDTLMPAEPRYSARQESPSKI